MAIDPKELLKQTVNEARTDGVDIEGIDADEQDVLDAEIEIPISGGDGLNNLYSVVSETEGSNAAENIVHKIGKQFREAFPWEKEGESR